MSKNTIISALRDLDPAPTHVLTEAELERADATLARILATPSAAHLREASVPPRRRRTRQLVPVGVVGAAGAAALALLLGGGSAFASWTPTPEPLSSASAGAAAATCRAALGMPDRGERVVVAESRGGWTFVLLAGPQAEGDCLMPDGLVGHQDPVDHTEAGFFGGYSVEPIEAPLLAPDRIDETTIVQGSVPAPGVWPFKDDDGWFSSVQGHVGSDVTGVTVHTPVGIDVQASVANGRFAAWWPSNQPSSENLDVMGAWTYTVTLADGGKRQTAG